MHKFLLAATNPEPRECPYNGKFAITGITQMERQKRSSGNQPVRARVRSKRDREESCDDGEATLAAGCESSDTLEFHSRCSKPKIISGIQWRRSYCQVLVLTQSTYLDPSTPFFTQCPISVSSFCFKYDESNISSRFAAFPPRYYLFLLSSINEMGNFKSRLKIYWESYLTTYWLNVCTVAYSCHGRWSDNDTGFLITTPQSRTSLGAKRYCFIYKEESGVVHFSSSSHTCVRNISAGVDGVLAFNATSVGESQLFRAQSLKSRKLQDRYEVLSQKICHKFEY